MYIRGLIPRNCAKLGEAVRQVESFAKEPGQTLVQSLGSEFGEGTGPNPGCAGSEFREMNGSNLSWAGSEFRERTWPNPVSEFGFEERKVLSSEKRPGLVLGR